MDCKTAFFYNFIRLSKYKNDLIISILFLAVLAFFLYDLSHLEKSRMSGVILHKDYFEGGYVTAKIPKYKQRPSYLLTVKVGEHILHVYSDANTGKYAQVGQNINFFCFKGSLTHYTYRYIYQAIASQAGQNISNATHMPVPLLIIESHLVKNCHELFIIVTQYQA